MGLGESDKQRTGGKCGCRLIFHCQWLAALEQRVPAQRHDEPRASSGGGSQPAAGDADPGHEIAVAATEEGLGSHLHVLDLAATPPSTASSR